eukprot:SM000038S14329  [mRNA]  locus=s38:245150:245489:+ [translate_table: standard]
MGERTTEGALVPKPSPIMVEPRTRTLAYEKRLQTPTWTCAAIGGNAYVGDVGSRAHDTTGASRGGLSPPGRSALEAAMAELVSSASQPPVCPVDAVELFWGGLTSRHPTPP